MPGQFTISLDFELLWGVKDHATRSSYGKSIIGARKVVPQLLEAFSNHELHATWATVGFLMCENKEELLDCVSRVKSQPTYTRSSLSNYHKIADVGDNEQSDPYSFASTLISEIASTPGQEIATHTLSHFYCLEEGATTESFRSDASEALRLAKEKGIRIDSIVFPRNQFDSSILEVCEDLQLICYRGNPNTWMHRPTKAERLKFLRRAGRLITSHTGIFGHITSLPKPGTIANVPASYFLRPAKGSFGLVHHLHIDTLLRGMRLAAENEESFHLWWHPHNFGLHPEENLAMLRIISEEFRRLNQEFGIVSKNMREVAQSLRAGV